MQAETENVCWTNFKQIIRRFSFFLFYDDRSETHSEN